MCPCLIVAGIVSIAILLIGVLHKLLKSVCSCMSKLMKKDSFVPDDNISDGSILSYYKTLNKTNSNQNEIVIGLHYTDWCGYCKLMKPVWQQVKNDLAKTHPNVVMVENDEQANPTRGISAYPTIVKFRGGKGRTYKGRADYQQLKEFILSTNIVETSGAAW
jgi:thiol-disulfide isomerase/thioredoxin